jgi:basic membrane protein A
MRHVDLVTKRRWLAALMLVAVLGLAVFAAGCGGDDEPAAEPSPAEPAEPPAEPAEEPPAEEPPAEPAPSAEGYRAAVLFPGTENDGSWANSWCDGAKEFAAESGAEIVCVGGLNEPDQYLQQASAFASEGYDMIVLAHGATGDVAVQLAGQFPDVQFCQSPLHPDQATLDAEPTNVCHLEFEQHHGNFVAGALAGLMTQTGTIGAVNGFAFPALTRQPEGFDLGARCVNPDVKFIQTYINSWEDQALAKAAADALIAQGADILVGATDQAVQGMYESAREAGGGVWIIPEYFDSNDQAPDVILTSVLYGIPRYAVELFNRHLNGELGQGPGADFIRFDLFDIEKLAPLYEDEDKVPADVLAQVQEIEAKLNSGEIVIPDESISDPNVAGGATIGAEGDAAKIDVASIGC